jgi:hypothetical protein
MNNDSVKKIVKCYLDSVDWMISDNEICPYTVVADCMGSDLRDALGEAIYAYHANQSAILIEAMEGTNMDECIPNGGRE